MQADGRTPGESPRTTVPAAYRPTPIPLVTRSGGGEGIPTDRSTLGPDVGGDAVIGVAAGYGVGGARSEGERALPGKAVLQDR